MLELNKEQDSYKWMILTITFLLMLTFAVSLQALPPMFEHIIKDIPFSNSQAGMLMGAYAIPGIFLPFLVAFLANKYDLKKMLMIALLIMILGLIAFSFSLSFTFLLMFRLIAGIGATVIMVIAPLLVTMFFDQKNIGIAMGIFNTAVPFGTVVSANIFGYLGLLLNWKLIILGIAAFVGIILMVVYFALTIPDVKKKKDSNIIQEKSHGKIEQKFKMSSSLWILTIIWATANAQFLAYMTFGPKFFQSLGMSVQRGGFLTSLVMLMSIFLGPLIGILIDKTGKKRPLLQIGSVLMGISFIFIVKPFLSLSLWTVMLGIGFAPIPIIVFSLLPEMVKPHQVGMGLGALTAAANLGITIGPAAFGKLLDLSTGNFLVGFISLATLSLVITVIGFGIKTDTYGQGDSSIL